MPEPDVEALQMVEHVRVTGRCDQVLGLGLWLALKLHLVPTWVDLNVPARDNAAIDKELVSARARDHVFEAANLLPRLRERRSKTGHGDRLLAQRYAWLDARQVPIDRQPDLLVTQPERDAIARLLLCGDVKELGHITRP